MGKREGRGKKRVREGEREKEREKDRERERERERERVASSYHLIIFSSVIPSITQNLNFQRYFVTKNMFIIKETHLQRLQILCTKIIPFLNS